MWAPVLRHCCVRRTYSPAIAGDAEDLLQTVLARTYLVWDRIRDPSAVDAYVRRAMVNTRTSLWRRRRLHERTTDALPEHPGPDEAAAVDQRLDLRDALWAALSELSRRQRAVVVLRHYEDLSEAEVAELLGISVGTVKSTTSKALARLRSSAALATSRPDDPHIASRPGAHP